ncbi:MAG TPA: hypothetical protein VI197_12255 [Polyangiaceae bacterium]
MSPPASVTLGGPGAPHWLRGTCRWLAVVVPLFVAIAGLSPASQWRNDVAIVRSLGFVPIGAEGVLSAVLAQVSSLLPLGGRVLRAALPSALGAACAARLIYEFALRLLDKNAPTERLAPVLALIAAWGVVLTPAWQAEATQAGGATVAVTLVLLATAVRFRLRLDERGWLVFGVLLGAACLEQRLAGLACLALLLADAALLRQLPTQRQLLELAGSAAGVVALGLVPFWFQRTSGGIWSDWGTELARLSGADTALPLSGTLDAWLDALGLPLLAAAALGCGWGISRPRTRPWILPLAVFPLLDLVLPAAAPTLAGPLTGRAVDLLALAVLGIAAAVGAQVAGLALERARVPLARPVQALVIVAGLTLVLVRMEESGEQAEAQTRGAAEAWTDEALSSLPPHSLLMVRSEPAAWRLWASRVARGERPDLTVVPLPLLDRGDTAARLLEIEPHLAPLVRELRMNGRPGEYALSTLADARPLFLEFDPSWDRRLLEHVLPHPFWMRFEAHALGRSDRTAALSQGKQAFARVLDSIDPRYPDLATLGVLTTRAREQTVMLAALGDRESALTLLEQLRDIPSERAFVSSMEKKLADKEKRRVDWLAQLQ